MKQLFLRLALFLAFPLFLTLNSAWSQGYSPAEAVQRMTLADGFQTKIVASEPMIVQPVAMEFDDRDRLWVVQYLQYPNPAGLKRAKVDRYSRTTYDRVPDPPPRGPQGADRITILEDTDGDGHTDRAKDFVNGLNLASGIAFGHGGVFILQTPYLLFYPDRNGDDVPDSDPNVLLVGFGLEDAHSVANSLTWGPDGWLYGCQGSTVTANIRGIEFQQGVWRYHPITREFELFCEGGGNSWGLDFDKDGELIYSTNFGGYRMLHGVQGAYYWKSFGKHGALQNPYAFGYFEHVPHRNFQGGHVTVGGIVYQGDSFPDRFRGKYISGDLLGHGVQWHELEPWGSTFKSSHGGELLVANDTWFAPSDVTMGPDGAIFVSDWNDQRTAHPDPDADWDRSNGRIYKIEASGTKPASPVEWAKLSSDKLLGYLNHKSIWFVRKARRILADRRDPETIFPLRALILETKNDQLALEGLWALYVSGGFNETLAEKLLSHRHWSVRRWSVRFLGDENRVSAEVAGRLGKLAETEPDVRVRSQLACTARRLPGGQGLMIVQKLLLRNEDDQDPYLPLLLWWAVEQHAVTSMDQISQVFASKSAWESPMIRDVILERLMRRYAAEGSDSSHAVCARLLASSRTAEDRNRMLAALERGLKDPPAQKADRPLGNLFETHAVVERENGDRAGRFAKVSPLLEQQLAGWWTDNTSDMTLIRLMARLDREPAQARALMLATDPGTPAEQRIALLQILGEAGRPAFVSSILKLLNGNEPEALQLAALEALHNFEQEEIAATLLRGFPRMNERVRSKARDVLLSRKPWALAFLREIDQGIHLAKEVPVEQLRHIFSYQDKKLDELVRKHWGNITGGTPEEKLAEMRRLSNDLRAGPGHPVQGRELFTKNCAVCHRLFDEGETLGPDLTHANRNDRDYLLVSMVDPSAVIRKEFLSYNVETTDGRFLTGLLLEESPNGVTLAGPNKKQTKISRDQLKSLQESPVSLMPENLLQALKPQELRDLFSYLQGNKAEPRP